MEFPDQSSKKRRFISPSQFLKERADDLIAQAAAASRETTRTSVDDARNSDDPFGEVPIFEQEPPWLSGVLERATEIPVPSPSLQYQDIRAASAEHDEPQYLLEDGQRDNATDVDLSSTQPIWSDEEHSYPIDSSPTPAAPRATESSSRQQNRVITKGGHGWSQRMTVNSLADTHRDSAIHSYNVEENDVGGHTDTFVHKFESSWGSRQRKEQGLEQSGQAEQAFQAGHHSRSRINQSFSNTGNFTHPDAGPQIMQIPSQMPITQAYQGNSNFDCYQAGSSPGYSTEQIEKHGESVLEDQSSVNLQTVPEGLQSSTSRGQDSVIGNPMNSKTSKPKRDSGLSSYKDRPWKYGPYCLLRVYLEFLHPDLNVNDFTSGLASYKDMKSTSAETNVSAKSSLC